jgi:hypothetical protein
MRNQKNRIQDSVEYQIVKQITSEENRKNIIEATKAFLILLAAFFITVWVFVNFLMWTKDVDIVVLIIDLLLWLKEITS